EQQDRVRHRGYYWFSGTPRRACRTYSIQIYASLTSSGYRSEFIFSLEIHRPFRFVWAVPSFLSNYIWMDMPQEFPMLQGYKMERKKEIRSVGEVSVMVAHVFSFKFCDMRHPIPC
ncbi:unnamed protein product, partial [Urochloa humidicola]